MSYKQQQMNRQQFELNQHFAFKNRMMVLSTLESMANRITGKPDSKKELKKYQTNDYSYKDLNQIIQQAEFHLCTLQASNNGWKQDYKGTPFRMPNQFSQSDVKYFLQKIRNDVGNHQQCTEILNHAERLLLDQSYNPNMLQKIQNKYVKNNPNKGPKNASTKQQFVHSYINGTYNMQKQQQEFLKRQQQNKAPQYTYGSKSNTDKYYLNKQQGFNKNNKNPQHQHNSKWSNKQYKYVGQKYKQSGQNSNLHNLKGNNGHNSHDLSGNCCNGNHNNVNQGYNGQLNQNKNSSEMEIEEPYNSGQKNNTKNSGSEQPDVPATKSLLSRLNPFK